MSKHKNLPLIYYVQARLNLDDPVLGVYPTEAQAVSRANLVCSYSEASFNRCLRMHTHACDVTDFIDLHLYVQRGGYKAKLLHTFTPYWMNGGKG